MDIEGEIFKKCRPDFKKLVEYGFLKNKDDYTIEKRFLDCQFRANITIDKKGKVKGRVFDEQSGEEYALIRVEGAQGAFLGEVRKEYKKLLEEIRETCFKKEYFKFSQTNRITKKIIEKYGDEPEFLWKKFEGTAIFRNKDTKKWYAVIMDIDKSKIIKGKKGLVEVVDLKLPSQEANEIVLQENFYRGYHMNKKYWISIILDDSVADDKILELVEKSLKRSL